jgi:large subunit ribosomal protein L15
MFKRKRKKINKYRGSRHCGTGNVKNKRGSGCRGGVGRGGIHKHKFSYATTYEPEWVKHGSRFGFYNPTRKEIKTLNLFEINNMLKKGEIKNNVFEFKGKILGTGEIENPPSNFQIIAQSFSKKAAERLKKANIKFKLFSELETKIINSKNQ